MGLYAAGDLTGTRVVGNTFSGGLRGALLDGARNLAFGQFGNGNTLSNSRAAASNPAFAGTGIRAEGNLSGTVVAGNTFTGNNYGFAFIGANSLQLRQNVFTRNSIAGIYVEGDSRGSNQSGNAFGTTRADRNKANLLRSQGARFGGAVVTPAGQPQVSVVQKRK
jgi:nitrous oxidase accessory protein NosD